MALRLFNDFHFDLNVFMRPFIFLTKYKDLENNKTMSDQYRVKKLIKLSFHEICYFDIID